MESKENINKMLKAKAMNLGLCRQWTDEWSLESDFETLVDKYKRGLDFCIEHNYPSNELIKTMFDRDALIENHIYVDENLDVSNCKSDIYVIQGDSDVSITFGDYCVATIFVRHSSKVSIVCKDHARVFVRLYDMCSAHVYQHNESKVFVKRHSDDVSLTTMGKITVKERNLDET